MSLDFWIALPFVLFGVLFGLLGNFGVLIFPDVYTRLHASSKCSTSSALSILIACMVLSGLTAMSGRILVISAFFFITSPVTSHIIGARAWKRGLLPYRHLEAEDD
jgi:multicomponent Na+:H+ antiporter subunit G